jgi:transcriptional regulator with XRE-family HTH domain
MGDEWRSLPSDAPFGVALRWWRERRRLSLTQLGGKVHTARQHLSEVELGHRGCSLDLAKRLDSALDAQCDLVRRLDVTPDQPGRVKAVRLPLLTASEAEAQMVDLLAELERSDVGAASIDAVEQVTEHLCSAYSTTPAEVLLPQVAQELRYILELALRQQPLRQRRRLLVAAGWLAVLRACLEFDRGAIAAAHASRAMTMRLAEEAGHQELLGWAWELMAWWSIVGRQYRRALDAARKGRAVAPAISSAMVQLNVQEAYASSRLGAADTTHEALRRAAPIVPELPPDDTRNHFVFDPAKLTFYAGHCHVVLGEAHQAEQLAREVIKQCGGRWTTRVLEAHIDLGLALVQLGRADEAAAAGAEALEQGPLCTTTLWRGSELDRALTTAAPTLSETRDLHERLVIARELLAL